VQLWGNKYDRWEFAGAFGDLGTLIPFVVGYMTVNKMDPVGILVAFGIFKICRAFLQNTYPNTTHESHRRYGHCSCEHHHSRNDLGFRDLHGLLLAFDGFNRCDHVDSELFWV